MGLFDHSPFPVGRAERLSDLIGMKPKHKYAARIRNPRLPKRGGCRAGRRSPPQFARGSASCDGVNSATGSSINFQIDLRMARRSKAEASPLLARLRPKRMRWDIRPPPPPDIIDIIELFSELKNLRTSISTFTSRMSSDSVGQNGSLFHVQCEALFDRRPRRGASGRRGERTDLRRRESPDVDISTSGIRDAGRRRGSPPAH
jgi:hypothetical protein